MTLPVTAIAAAICAIMLLATAFDTVRQRQRARIAFGIEGDVRLAAASRAHANLAEHAPLFIILLGLLELANAHHWGITGIAAVFLAARAAHIVGLHQPHDSGPPALRVLSVLATWLAYAALIGWTLFLVVTVNS